MRGRKPRSLRIVADDVPILHQISRSRSLPWYQVQRAQILVGVAAGEPIHQLSVRTQCDPSTIWRVCRRYECSGLPDLLAPANRTGRPARFPPATGSDRPIGMPGTNRQGIAHHSLDEQGSGPPSGQGWPVELRQSGRQGRRQHGGHEVVPGDRIQHRDRLIQHQQPRQAGQRQGQRQLRLLPAGQPARLPPGRDTQLIEPGHRVALVETPVLAAGQPDHVRDRQVLVQRRVLGHERDLVQRGRRPRPAPAPAR